MVALHQRRSSRKIDNTLPAAHTQKLYGSLPGGRAYWLSTYAKTLGFREDGDVDLKNIVDLYIDRSMICESFKVDKKSTYDSMSFNERLVAKLQILHIQPDFLVGPPTYLV